MATHHSKQISNLTFDEIINTFSVWVILGVPLSYAFFCEMLAVTFQWEVLVAISVSLFIIYTLDHVLDGLKWKEKSLALRHFIHFRYRKYLLILAAIALTSLSGFVYLYLDKTSLQFGIFISVAVLVYFVLNFILRKIFRKLVPLKEFIVALIVTCCLVALPFLKSTIPLSTDIILLFISILMLNFSNLLCFSYYDYEVDKRSRFNGTSKVISQENLKMLIISLVCVGLTLSVYSGIHLKLDILQISVLVVMFFQLLVIMLFDSIYMKNERYRFWGDIIFIYPLFYFFAS